MTVQIGATGTRAERLRAAAKTKDRNRKIALGALIAVFVVILAVEVPSMLSKLSGNSGGGTSAPPQPAVATSQPAATMHPSLAPSLRSVDKFPTKDPFVAQVGAVAGSQSAAVTAGPHTVAGPAVRTKNFTAKDPFVAQLALPSAPSVAPATTPAKSSTGGTAPVSSLGSGYVVVLNSVPAAHSQKLASLAVVAAENAGLLDVRSSALSTTGGTVDIYTGPYSSQAVAQQELIRALRDGYTQATVTTLHSHSSQ